MLEVSKGPMLLCVPNLNDLDKWSMNCFGVLTMLALKPLNLHYL